MKDDAVDLAAVYKDLHANPELGFHETRTAALVAGQLSGSGFEVTTGVGGTGVVGLLSNGDGPLVLLRADMDALPVEEKTGLPYASVARAITTSGTEARSGPRGSSGGIVGGGTAADARRPPPEAAARAARGP